jgi:uncharacterized cupin superfamily protein
MMVRTSPPPRERVRGVFRLIRVQLGRERTAVKALIFVIALELAESHRGSETLLQPAEELASPFVVHSKVRLPPENHHDSLRWRSGVTPEHWPRRGLSRTAWHGSTMGGDSFVAGTVSEAGLRETRFGLAPDGEGWFVVNARDVGWRDYGPLGAACNFEGKRPFRQIGINLNRLLPGQPMTVYHQEFHQEGFLVLAGECLLLVDGDERRMVAWNFFHCPGGIAHAIVGAGDGPSLVLAVGARGGRKGIEYLPDAVALAHGAAVEQPTKKYAGAHAHFPRPTGTRCGDDWLPER